MTLQQQLAEMREENCILQIQTGFICKDTKYCCKSCRPYYTLQAILDIHKPELDPLSAKPEEPYCAGCWDAQDDYYALRWVYPCPTVEAITTALATVAEVAGEGMRG